MMIFRCSDILRSCFDPVEQHNRFYMSTLDENATQKRNPSAFPSSRSCRVVGRRDVIAVSIARGKPQNLASLVRPTFRALGE